MQLVYVHLPCDEGLGRFKIFAICKNTIQTQVYVKEIKIC